MNRAKRTTPNCMWLEACDWWVFRASVRVDISALGQVGRATRGLNWP